MSAVSRAIEIRRQCVEEQAAESGLRRRWGPPIWPAEEPIDSLERAARRVIPLEILAVMMLHGSRS